MTGETSGGRFRGVRAAVTGAGGFIGAAVAAALAREGASVAGLDLRLPEPAAPGVEPVGADVSDPAALAPALDGAELVVHTAARVDEGRDMDDFVRVNVRGTANVLDAARGARVVHLSSVAVFGYEFPGEIDDDAPLRASGIPYIDTKAASDRLARLRGAVVVRPGDVYGARSVPWVLRPLELARARRLAYPSRDARMLPVHVDDLVAAILLAAERGEPGRAYTAWSGEAVTFAEYFKRLCAAAGAPPPRRLPRAVLAASAAAAEALDRARGQRPRLSPVAITFIARRGTIANRRAREELGWESTVPLGQGIARSVRAS